MTDRPLKTAVLLGHAQERRQVFPPDVLALLPQSLRWIAPPTDAQDFRRRLQEFDRVETIFGTWGMPQLDEEVLAAMPRLEAVFYGAGSVRKFVTPTFWKRDIRLCSAVAVNAIPVADYTLAALIFGLKGVWPAARETAMARTFQPQRAVLAPGTYCARVGLLGFGLIAREVRRRLRHLEVEVLICDPFVKTADAIAANVQPVDLETLFARCDAVSVHLPLLPETTGLVRGSHLRALRPHAVFVNTARGKIVNEPEMIKALQDRPDLEAFIDVTDPEPPLPASPLYTLPNVHLTPHIAGSIGPELARLGRTMVEEYLRLTTGQPLQYELLEHQAALMT